MELKGKDFVVKMPKGQTNIEKNQTGKDVWPHMSCPLFLNSRQLNVKGVGVCVGGFGKEGEPTNKV